MKNKEFLTAGPTLLVITIAKSDFVKWLTLKKKTYEN